nr:TetR/AcrR family transcriptional regulator [Oceanobacter mangrovi]
MVAQAFQLFYQQGIYAVGINKVLEHSGIARKTLYHHFASKEDLVAATVAYRDQMFRDWLFGRMATVDAGKPALLAMFAALDDWFHNREPHMPEFHGCYFINVSAEFSDPTHPIHQQCAEHKRLILQQIQQQLQAAGVPAAECESLADHIAMLKEGAIVQAHVMGDKQAAIKAGRLVDALVGA